MKKIIFISLFNLIAVSGYCQLANLDFENWYTDTSGKLRLYNWEHLTSWPNTTPNAGMFGTWQDSSAEHGVYALKISRWYNYLKDWVRQKAAISSRPGALSGYYKYIDNDLSAPYTKDTALIEVILTKWNATNATNDTVGFGSIKLMDIATYTQFNCVITYRNGSTPDSITVNLKPSSLPYNEGLCPTSGTCSYLTIDNLSLLPSTEVGYIETQYANIYPNPVKDKLIINLDPQVSESLQLNITDLYGRTVVRNTNLKINTQLDLSQLATGAYLLFIKNDKDILEVRKLIKE